jgi:hypothetical protein
MQNAVQQATLSRIWSPEKIPLRVAGDPDRGSQLHKTTRREELLKNDCGQREDWLADESPPAGAGSLLYVGSSLTLLRDAHSQICTIFFAPGSPEAQ